MLLLNYPPGTLSENAGRSMRIVLNVTSGLKSSNGLSSVSNLSLLCSPPCTQSMGYIRIVVSGPHLRVVGGKDN